MQSNILEKLINKEILTNSEIDWFVNKLAQNELPDSVIGTILMVLTTKGMNCSELSHFIKSIQKHSKTNAENKLDAIACIGTGADAQNTFNITTTASIVASSCGVKIIKKAVHGSNKKTGNISFLRELGIKICKTEKETQEQFNKNNIAFYEGSALNNIENTINRIRNELKIQSKLNISEALIQPIKTSKIFLGTAFPNEAETLINTIKSLGYTRAIMVSAQNPLLDEISICSETTVWELKDGEIEKYELTPDNFGIKRSDILSLRGATAKYNANLVLDIFNGKIKDAKLDIIAMNAGAMIYLADKSRNYLDGIMQAYTAISKGLAIEKIQNLQQ